MSPKQLNTCEKSDEVDRTLDSGESLIRAGRAPAIVRAGSPSDYQDLVSVDPRHYVIGSEIARGGMGRILSARDRRLGRTVAIKEVLAVSGSARERFEREIRITARLQHPSIVNVLEAGEWPNSDPFFAMKLVAGQSLDRAIHEKKTLEERLSLLPNVIAVVDAIAYAHAQRVIHRDLKPSNVLVGAFGETVVIDWGLAKDLASEVADPSSGQRHVQIDANETAEGSIVGTPAYMPPEQALGDHVDERADVYALGAMLYHTVSGQPAFSGRTAEELLDQVISGSPPSVGTAAPGLPPDLVAIIDKAMAFEAADRYPSAGELASDLKKFQTGQLVGAHRYSGWQLARRWLRRNRGAVVVATIAMTLLAAFAVTSVFGIMRERERTEHQRVAAEANRAQAEDLMDFMLGDLKDKLEPVGKLPLLDVVARKALAYYAQRPDTKDPKELRGRATALTNIGEVLVKQGGYEDARAEFNAALAIQSRLVAYAPLDGQLAHDIAATHAALGDLFRRQARLDDAMREYASMVAVLEPVVARTTSSDADRMLLALGIERIGWMQTDRGETAAALASFQRSRDIRLTLDSANPQAQLALSVSHDSIGAVREIRGELTEALAEYRAGAAMRMHLIEIEPTNMHHRYALAASYDHVGGVLATLGDSAAALDDFRAEEKVAEYLTERDATNAEWLDLLGMAKTRVGDMLHERGDNTLSLATYRSAAAIHGDLMKRDPSNLEAEHHAAIDYDKIGYMLERAGDLDGALAEFQASKAIREERSRRDPTNVQWQRDVSLSLDGIAEVQLARGKTDEALATYRDNLALAERVAATDVSDADWQRDVGLAHQQVGAALLRRKDPHAARVEIEAALAIFDALVAKDPGSSEAQRDAASCRYKLGDALFDLRDFTGARAAYETGRAAIEALLRKDPNNARWCDDLAVGLDGVASASRALGDRAAALEASKAELAITEKELVLDPSNVEIKVYIADLRKEIAHR